MYDYCVQCCTIHHLLFFQGFFSCAMWYASWERIPNHGIPCRVMDVMEWFNLNVKGKDFRCLVMRSVLAAAVYVI